MLAFRVAEHLDVIAHVLSSSFAHPVSPAPDPFALEQAVEVFCNRIVMTVAAVRRQMIWNRLLAFGAKSLGASGFGLCCPTRCENSRLALVTPADIIQLVRHAAGFSAPIRSMAAFGAVSGSFWAPQSEPPCDSRRPQAVGIEDTVTRDKQSEDFLGLEIVFI